MTSVRSYFQMPGYPVTQRFIRHGILRWDSLRLTEPWSNGLVPKRPRIDARLALPDFDVFVCRKLHRVRHDLCACGVTTLDHELAKQSVVGAQVTNFIAAPSTTRFGSHSPADVFSSTVSDGRCVLLIRARFVGEHWLGMTQMRVD